MGYLLHALRRFPADVYLREWMVVFPRLEQRVPEWCETELLTWVVSEGWRRRLIEAVLAAPRESRESVARRLMVLRSLFEDHLEAIDEVLGATVSK